MAEVEVQSNARHAFVTPANSTDFYVGDAVMLDSSNRLAPLALTAIGTARFVGFSTDKWNSQIAYDKYGTVDAYSTPASFSGGADHKLHVLAEDTVVSLSITQTSGKLGNTVYASTVTAGAMIFTLLKPASGTACVPIGRLERDFSGATANDKQRVVVTPAFRNSAEPDMQWWINNHVESGLIPAFDCTSLISYTAGGAFVMGKFFSVARATAALGVVCASHASKARIVLYYIGLGGTARIKDTAAVRFTFTTAGTTAKDVIRNSRYWPTFSLEGVVFGGGLLRSASQDIKASRVVAIRRTAMDFGFRKYITGNPTTAAPTLR